MKQQFTTHIHSGSGDMINHTFDKNPQAYYGTNNYCSEINPGGISVATPGMMSGLYRPGGPLTICPAHCVSSILTKVSTKSKISLEVFFYYTNAQVNKSIVLEKDKLYTITYLENGDIKKCSGKIIDIYKVYNIDQENIYKIKLDCSVNYNNQVVVIKNDQIRDAKLYVSYAEEDTTILNSLHRFGTTVGLIKNAIVTNATVDKNGNIIEGTIVDGFIDGHTVDGLAQGENQFHHEIIVINGNTLHGQIQGGFIMNGIVRSGDIDGVLDNDTNITEKATVRGIIANVVIVNSTVKGGKTTGGKVIDPTLYTSTVVDGQVTGDDMITTGGITAGDITTGGTTTGGTVSGGTATGVIDDKRFNIEDGITVPVDSDHKLITTGGIVTGGTIIGGTQIGGVIIGAIIKGGVVTNGTTTGGTTTGGTLVPVITNQIPISKPAHYNPDYDKINADNRPTDEIFRKQLNTDDLVVWTNQDTGQVDSNIGTAKIQGIEDLKK